MKNYAVVKNISGDSLTLAVSKRGAVVLSKDTKEEFEKAIAQILECKISVDYIVDENLAVQKVSEPKKNSNMSFLEYTLKIFETTKYEKISEE